MTKVYEILEICLKEIERGADVGPAAFAHRAIGKDIDVERRHFGAQDRIVEFAMVVLASKHSAIGRVVREV